VITRGREEGARKPGGKNLWGGRGKKKKKKRSREERYLLGTLTIGLLGLPKKKGQCNWKKGLGKKK